MREQFPVHVRIKKESIADRWKRWGLPERIAYASAAVLLFLYMIVPISLIKHHGNALGGRDLLEVIVLFSILPLLCLITLAYTLHTPERCGEIVFGDKIRFRCRNMMPYKSISYADVKDVYIGPCPSFFTVTLNRRYRGLLDPAHNAAYGERYIVAGNAERDELFVFTFQEEGWRLLQERCPSARFFDTFEAYQASLRKQDEETMHFVEEMSKKNGISDYGGYIN